jgi:hypothetical protein
MNNSGNNIIMVNKEKRCGALDDPIYGNSQRVVVEFITLLCISS